MKVGDLQAFLKNLGAPLLSLGVSQSVRADLERLAALLEPFQALTLPQLGDFLVKAEEYQRTGVLPATGSRARTKVPKAGPLSIAEAAKRVLALYERAADPALQYAEIEAEINKLDKALSKDQLLAVAKEAGISIPLKTKKVAVEEIKRKITERKGSFERTQFRDGPALR